MAGTKITITVEELLPAGSLDPNEIPYSRILVNRIFQGRNTRNRLDNLQ
jgi:acyl CoA:acetate/3-ketoacid CoA transferase alpha subunit